MWDASEGPAGSRGRSTAAGGPCCLPCQPCGEAPADGLGAGSHKCQSQAACCFWNLSLDHTGAVCAGQAALQAPLLCVADKGHQSGCHVVTASTSRIMEALCSWLCSRHAILCTGP